MRTIVQTAFTDGDEGGDYRTLIIDTRDSRHHFVMNFHEIVELRKKVDCQVEVLKKEFPNIAKHLKV